MRERPVSPATVERYIKFLNEIVDRSHTDNNPFSVEQVASSYKVSRSAFNSLTRLKIIESKGTTKWVWLRGDPDKQMVLEILDYNLHKRKEQIPALLPDYVTILGDISKKLDKIATNTNKSIVEPDLRFELIKSVTTALYTDFKVIPTEYAEKVDNCNKMILYIVDDLLLKLNKK